MKIRYVGKPTYAYLHATQTHFLLKLRKGVPPFLNFWLGFHPCAYGFLRVHFVHPPFMDDPPAQEVCAKLWVSLGFGIRESVGRRSRTWA